MNYKTFCYKLAKKAWEIIKKNVNREKNISYKEGEEVVTEVDGRINQIVIDEIYQTYLSHGVLGEEGDAQKNKLATYQRITDPIDGTIPYARGIKSSCFSLALLENGKPILWCVYQPYNDELYYAEKGKGATCNDQEISVSTNELYQKGTILWLTSRLSQPYNIKPVRDALFEKNVSYYDFWTVTYMWCLVAAWKMDAIIFPHHKPYDLAAVKVIVEEAWGKETDLFGQQQRFDKKVKGNIVSNWLLHEELLASIKKYTSFG